MTVQSFSFPTRIHFGPGARSLLADSLKGAGCARPLLLTDASVAALDFFGSIVSDLTSAELAVSVFSDGGGNPVASQVDAGVEAFRAHDADAIVAIGGGAPIDVAKAVALMVNHPGDLFDYEDGKPDARPVDQPIPYTIAIATTAGTGSEVGRSSVISVNDTKAKKIIFDPKLLPSVAILDPELTLGLPPKLTATTGMDALTHNVEAFIARGYHPMADGIALEAIRLIGKSLRTAVDDGKNVEARGEMLLASLMGAVAFQKGLGITHSLAHPLSTVCDMHHGLANGIMIRYAMEFNADTVPERFARMAQTVGADPSVEGFMGWLLELRAGVGIPDKLSDVGVTTDHLDDLVYYGIRDVCHPSNPRAATEEDFRTLYKAAL